MFEVVNLDHRILLKSGKIFLIHEGKNNMAEEDVRSNEEENHKPLVKRKKTRKLLIRGWTKR